MARLAVGYSRPSDDVLDIGGVDVNGSYRPLFESCRSYTSLDVDSRADVVVADHNWDLDNESYDVVLAGQVFEHDKFFWLTMKNIARVLRPGGVAMVIAPSRGHYHPYPRDYWRFYPDSMHALAEWAELDLLEAQTTSSEIWRDAVGVMRKPAAVGTPSRVLVTGLGGSGTRYMARVLSESGIAALHESAFTRKTKQGWQPCQQIEVSSLAVPDLDNLPSDLLVVHQVRSLDRWLPSYAKGIQTADEDRRRFLNSLLPGVTKRRPTNAALKLWTAVNRRISRIAFCRIRVEAVDVDVVQSIGRLVGVDVDVDAVQRALAAVPRNEGSRQRRSRKRFDPVGVRGEDARHAVGLARWYGYKL